MNKSLKNVAQNLTEKYFPCSLEIGKRVEHPNGRMCEIIDGEYMVDGRLSNFWYWRFVMPDGSLSKIKKCGYGW